MALTVNKEPVVVQSTGEVAFNDDYQKPISFDPAPGAAGEVDMLAAAGEETVVMRHLAADVVVREPPRGPITSTQWPADTVADRTATRGRAARAAASPAPSPADDAQPPPKPAQKRAQRRTKAASASATEAEKGATTKVVKPPAKRTTKKTTGAQGK